MDLKVGNKDPILLSGPEAQAELLKRFAADAAGFPMDAVLGAACNIIVSALRQAYASKNLASNRFDELFARTKSILLDEHYDANGRKRGIFPFAQHISAPFVKIKDAAQGKEIN